MTLSELKDIFFFRLELWQLQITSSLNPKEPDASPIGPKGTCTGSPTEGRLFPAIHILLCF